MEKFKYSIIPISYRDYNELVDNLNELGENGILIISELRRYKNSPEAGVDTIDFICKEPTRTEIVHDGRKTPSIVISKRDEKYETLKYLSFYNSIKKSNPENLPVILEVRRNGEVGTFKVKFIPPVTLERIKGEPDWIYATDRIQWNAFFCGNKPIQIVVD